MADGITYGINFPFRDSRRGDYLELTELESQEIKADLIHLLLTRKGSRYFLPSFGTNLYQFLFEPLTETVINAIKLEIKTACENFLPNLKINNINDFEMLSNMDFLEAKFIFIGSNEKEAYQAFKNKKVYWPTVPQ